MPTHGHIGINSKSRVLQLVGFFFGFAVSLTTYVASSYFQQSVGKDFVSLFFLIPNVLHLVFFFLTYRIVRYFGKSGALLICLLVHILLLFLLMGIGASFAGALVFMIYLFAVSVLYGILDIVLESVSDDNHSGRIRGAYLAFSNLGFLFGPFVSTSILATAGYSRLFGIVAAVTFTIFSISLWFLRAEGGVPTKEISLVDVIRSLVRNKNLFSIYLLSVTLEFFYAIMTIYTPLVMLHSGMNWNQIGVVFFVMLVPFVLLQYPAGKLADKKWGEKEMIMVSLGVMALCTSVLWFGLRSVAFWAIFLFGTRVGAALLEVLRDSYFYKKVDSTDVELIAFFRTARPTGYMIGSGAVFLLLLFFPMKSIFLFAGVVLLGALIPAWYLEDTTPQVE